MSSVINKEELQAELRKEALVVREKVERLLACRAAQRASWDGQTDSSLSWTMSSTSCTIPTACSDSVTEGHGEESREDNKSEENFESGGVGGGRRAASAQRVTSPSRSSASLVRAMVDAQRKRGLEDRGGDRRRRDSGRQPPQPSTSRTARAPTLTLDRWLVNVGAVDDALQSSPPRKRQRRLSVDSEDK